MKKILHITNWYPNPWNDLEGIFIKKQFDLFKEVTDSQIVNVQVREGKKFFEFKHFKYSKNEEGYFIFTNIKSSKIKEILTTLLLLCVLFKKKYKQFDLLHFHIAYPLLIHYYLWKKLIKIPVIISEHWSAYHFNFYMPKKTKKLNGIKRIFKQNIPIITVSKALLKDIEEFSGEKQNKYLILPNVINENIFYFKKNPQNEIPVFFTVNNWRKIKNPIPMLEGFKKLKEKNISYLLIIGGYGEMIDNMKKFVIKNKLEEDIQFVGKLNEQEIANYLSESDCYLHSAVYETFSIVIAQALMMGVPVICPNIPAIKEYADENMVIFLKDNNGESWKESLEYFIENKTKFNRKQISEKIKDRFSFSKIKEKYIRFIYEK